MENNILNLNRERLVLCVLYYQERELVLKRIAEDRRILQEKSQSPATETSSPSDQGQRLGGKIQTNVDNNCILMVRLEYIFWHQIGDIDEQITELFLCFTADSAAIWWINAWTLSSWCPSAQRCRAHRWTLPLPTHLFSPPGFPSETLRWDRAWLLATLSRPHTQRCTVYSDHSSRDTSRSTESCRTTISRTEWAIPCATTSSCPCRGGCWRARPSTPSTTQPFVGRSSELCWDPWSWSFTIWALSLLG